MHIRILNDKHTRLIDIKDALTEINHAMMDGKDDVEEMSASGSSASILYTDGRRVILRPATAEEIEKRDGKEWSYTHSNFGLWHRFNNDLSAFCNKRIRSKDAGHISVKDANSGKWISADLIGHDSLKTLPEAEKFSITLCPKCFSKENA